VATASAAVSSVVNGHIMTTTDKLGTAELLYRCAELMGLEPVWLEADSLFSISTLVGERYVFYAKSTLNSHVASSLARNKLSTRLILERHGLPSIAYLDPTSQAVAQDFLARHHKIIVKPQTGSNSRGVSIVDTPAQLAALDLRECIIEEYIAGVEIRYLVLNNEVIGVHESQYGESVAESRNLARISHPRAQWDPQLAALARKTAQILGLRYAAVDYLITATGQASILEVNSAPGMKWFHAPTSGPVVDVARLFLEALLDDLTAVSARVDEPFGTSPILAYS